MNPLLASGLTLAACWAAWPELMARIPGLAAALPLALVVVAVCAPVALRLARGEPLESVPIAPLAFLLTAYAAAVWLGPPLLRIAPAILALGFCLNSAAASGVPRAALCGLLLLALPVLPSLEFYGAYPVRLAAIETSAALLRMNGIDVDVEGLGIRFGTQLVQFDAPCSGVRMMWTCWFLASALGLLYRFPWWRYAIALVFATAIAIAGNVLRATSLFYLEAKLLAFEEAPWAHEAVGIAAFCLTALLLCALLRPRRAGAGPGIGGVTA